MGRAIVGLPRYCRLEPGDGLGYDVLSFDSTGNELFIEVKTTRKPQEYPFMVSRNEIKLSSEVPGQFQLYRVYNFDKPKTGLYRLAGSLEETCHLSSTNWLARPA